MPSHSVWAAIVAALGRLRDRVHFRTRAGFRLDFSGVLLVLGLTAVAMKWLSTV